MFSLPSLLRQTSAAVLVTVAAAAPAGAVTITTGSYANSGMGAEFATQADVRIITTRARIAWNFVHRGLVPDTGAGSWLLPRLIGVSQALRLIYSGEFLSPDDAVALGFAAQVVERGPTDSL